MYSLKNLPPLYGRPAPLNGRRWLYALFFIVFISATLLRIFGGEIKGHGFWLLAVGIPFACWFILGCICVINWVLKDLKASSYDKQREKWILIETRRSRRAFQVLSTSIITGHRVKNKGELLSSLIMNEAIIFSQKDRAGNEGVRLSRIGDDNDNLSEIIMGIFNELICKLPLSYIPDTTNLVIALDGSSVIAMEKIKSLWVKSWSEVGSLHSIELTESTGPGMLDYWLNNRIKDNSLLLVIALQLAPTSAANSAETAVALLLGNRLMQESITPIAILHRPDPSPAEELESGMRMAAYNVPINDGVLKHLWLSGLNDQQHAEVVKNQNKSPARAVVRESVINLDNSMGHAGAAAPWLAIAVASETAQHTQLPQMIICGDTTKDVLWSTLITPVFSRQEMDS